MAPKRKTATRAASADAGTDGKATTGFICPECGRTFQRAAALGAHRRRAHNVVGKTAKTASRSTGRRATATTTRPAATRRGPRATTAAPSSPGINRNALLKTLFPNGIPANEEAIRSVNDWLSEAERLAGLK